MLKVRYWLVSSLIALGLVAGAGSAQAATLVEHNVQPLGLTPNAGSPPEFGRCIKTTGGEFENSGCTKAAAGSSGSYEWHPAFGGSAPLENAGFSATIKEGTTSVLETVSGTRVTCESASSSGEYTGDDTIGSVVMTFTKCAAFGSACSSSGSTSGTVVTRTLEGLLGVEEYGAAPVENAIAEELFPVGGSGAIAEFSCSGLPVTITGSVLTQVPSNAMKAGLTVKFRATKGKQKPEGFVGEPAGVLFTKISTGAAEQAGESMSVIQTSEEKVEINSVV